MEQSDRLIMEPFNGVFWCVFAIFTGIFTTCTMILRNKPEKVKEKAFLAICLVVFIMFFVYKYFLSIDEEYDVITSNMGGFNWWGELPLQLCNINMILIPVGIITQNRALLSFCFSICLRRYV